jgi:hypothetical protein
MSSPARVSVETADSTIIRAVDNPRGHLVGTEHSAL